MKFYAWEHADGMEIEVSLNEEPPKDGPWSSIYTFEAATWEEGMAIHFLRQGWNPYRPSGKAAECPTCKATYYPAGSGVCWRCGISPGEEDAGGGPHPSNA